MHGGDPSTVQADRKQEREKFLRLISLVSESFFDGIHPTVTMTQLYITAEYTF